MTTHEAVIWHPDARQILRAAAALPRFDWPEGTTATAFLRAALDRPTWLLHDGGHPFGLGGPLHLQALDSALPAVPPGLRWTPADLPPALRVQDARPWQRPGWHQTTLTRLDHLLQARGHPRQGAPRLVSTTDLNTVWAVPTGAGDVYLKVSLQVLEAAVAAHLQRTAPDLLPEVLHTDLPGTEAAASGGKEPDGVASGPGATAGGTGRAAARRSGSWLLSASGGTLLAEVPETAAWEAAVQGLARLHRQDHGPAFARLGAPAWPFGQVADALPAFLEDEATLRGWGLNAQTLAVLEQGRPRIRQGLRAVQALGWPDRAVHGDAHARNALVGARGGVWFDWSEALSAAHPLSDLGWLLTGLHLHPQRFPVLRSAPQLATCLGAVYLRALGEPGAASVLRWVPLVTLLQRALIYDRQFRAWRGTLPGVRPNYVPYSLRLAARLLTEQDRWAERNTSTGTMKKATRRPP